MKKIILTLILLALLFLLSQQVAYAGESLEKHAVYNITLYWYDRDGELVTSDYVVVKLVWLNDGEFRVELTSINKTGFLGMQYYGVLVGLGLSGNKTSVRNGVLSVGPTPAPFYISPSLLDEIIDTTRKLREGVVEPESANKLYSVLPSIIQAYQMGVDVQARRNTTSYVFELEMSMKNLTKLSARYVYGSNGWLTYYEKRVEQSLGGIIVSIIKPLENDIGALEINGETSWLDYIDWRTILVVLAGVVALVMILVFRRY